MFCLEKIARKLYKSFQKTKNKLSINRARDKKKERERKRDIPEKKVNEACCYKCISNKHDYHIFDMKRRHFK